MVIMRLLQGKNVCLTEQIIPVGLTICSVIGSDLLNICGRCSIYVDNIMDILFNGVRLIV